MDRAAAMLGDIPAAEVAAEVAAVNAALTAHEHRLAQPPAASSDRRLYPGGPVIPAIPQDRDLAGLTLEPATTRALAADPAAALLVAAALDRNVPEIAAARGAAPDRSGATVAGCDLVDQSPYLCVGSNADHVYSGDEMLLVALGGNNTYRGGAGSAPFLPPGSPAGQTVPVSVSVDVGGGTDTYQAAPSSLNGTGTTLALVMGEGGAVTGGLAFCVNLGGDDTYTAVGAPPAAPAPGGYPYDDTVVQGGAILGAGFLFDGGGNDTFSVTQPRLATPGGLVGIAQGAAQGLGSGIGALVTWGGGADTYTVDIGGADARQAGVFTLALAQGATNGDGATGLLADDGGTDTFRVTGTSRDALTTSLDFTSATDEVSAQGAASIGSGFLLEGPGTHAYTLSVDLEGGGSALPGIAGQGAAGLGGQAILQDTGSGAAYDLEVLIHHQENAVVDDACRCPGAVTVDGGAGDQPANLDSQYTSWPALVYGQGGAGNGVAVLDNAGSATYRTVVTATMDVSLADRRTAPPGPARLSVHGFGGPIVYAQGAGELGFPFETATSALLLNRSGHAAYTLTTGDSVRASATSTNGTAPVVSARSAFQWNAAGQGAMIWSAVPTNGESGALLDLGGPGDTLSVVQDTSATTAPDSGQGISPGGFWMPSHGGGRGGLLVVAGPSPTIVASPANGICPLSTSPRGFGAWVACDEYAVEGAGDDADHQAYDYLGGDFYGPAGRAEGLAPQASGAPPALTLRAPGSGVEGSALPVRVTLADSAGHPLAGRPVHVSLQAGLPIPGAARGQPPTLEQWLDLGEVTLVTGPDGSATGALPVALASLVGAAPKELIFDNYRVLATFDGEAGIYPSHIPSAVTLGDRVPPADAPEAPAVALLGLAGLLGAAITAVRRRRTARCGLPGTAAQADRSDPGTGA